MWTLLFVAITIGVFGLTCRLGVKLFFDILETLDDRKKEHSAKAQRSKN